MTQKQINQQWLNIAKAVTKAYKGAEKGLINNDQFNSKLKCAEIARNGLRAAQNRFNHRGY